MTNEQNSSSFLNELLDRILIVFALFAKNKKIALITFVLAVVLAVSLFFILPRKFTSEATLLPSGSSSALGTLGFLAGLLPQELMATDASYQSSLLFPKIMQSREVLSEVINSEYDIRDDYLEFKGTLMEYKKIPNLDEAIEWIKTVVDINMDFETGLIQISVTSKSPTLSRDILKNLIMELEDFNQNKRRSKSRDNYEYVVERLNYIDSELLLKEKQLLEFMKDNRNYDQLTSPELYQQYNQLKREVDKYEEITISLSRQKELANLELQKSIPIVSVLDSANVPLKKASPKGKLLLFAILMLAFVLLLFYLLFKNLLKNDPNLGNKFNSLKNDGCFFLKKRK